MNKIAEFFSNLAENHMLFRRLTLIWACYLIERTISGFWDNFAGINEYHVPVILGVIGILATVIGFYLASRRR